MEIRFFFNFAGHIKLVFGVRIFYALFRGPVLADQRQLLNYHKVCTLLLDLVDEPDIFQQIHRHLPNLELLIESLSRQRLAVFSRKYPLRTADALVANFSATRFSMTEAEKQHLKTVYQEITQIGLPYWREHFYGIKLPEESNVHRPSLLSAIFEASRIDLKMMPNDTQIMAILSLLDLQPGRKGRIAQMKTGEGKSWLIAIVALFYALHGYFVDVVTPSRYLAKRDYKKFKYLFKRCKISASHIATDEPQKRDFKGQILYGTNTDFEFAYLRDGLYQTQFRHSLLKGKLQPRRFDVVIADEVDNLLLTMALNSAILAIATEEDFSWIYPTIFEFVKSLSLSGPVPTPILHIFAVTLQQDLCTRLAAAQVAWVQATPMTQFVKWIQSAIQALYVKKEKEDYVVKSVTDRSGAAHAPDAAEARMQIVIVDQENTGCLHENSQWQHGLHQFLQLKHGLPVTAESLTAASISHPSYFNKYRAILGLTGTIGNPAECKEIENTYYVDIREVPAHRVSQRIHVPEKIARNKNEQWESILARLKLETEQNRPRLLLFETIQEVEAFSAFLRQNEMAHQALSGIQSESEDFLVARAGETGVITLATNIAGRGTDFVLTEESLAAGGLEVIFTFFPKSARAYEQGIGRAGRQGQVGSFTSILNLEDKYIQKLLRDSTHRDHLYSLFSDGRFEAIMQQLEHLRSIQIETESTLRYQCTRREGLFSVKQDHFFKQLDQVSQVLAAEETKQAVLGCFDSEPPTRPASQTPADKLWKNLHTYTAQLLAQGLLARTEGKNLFWTRFSATYLSAIQQRWATLFSQLQNVNAVENLDELQTEVDSIYQRELPALQLLLENPEINIKRCAEAVFTEVRGCPSL